MSRKGSIENRSKRRMIFIFFLCTLLLVALIFRLGWIQIVKGDEYGKMALAQQTRDTPINAKRGMITDRDGNILALNATANTIWLWPADMKDAKNEAEGREKLNNAVDKLSQILGMDEEQVYSAATKDASLVKLAKNVDDDTAKLIRAEKLSGVSIVSDVRRYYPYGTFACHLLGSTNDDNNGVSGIELKYNDYLSGSAGRWIKNTDVKGQQLSYGTEKYYEAQDGYTVRTTIDQMLQHYAEQSVEEVYEKTQADKVTCLIMGVKTGEVLAMASAPFFNPNDPRAPSSEEQAELMSQMTDEEKVSLWNKTWRNSMVSDVYEPGSTFKLLTTAMALEEGVTSPNEQFTCTGYYKVADRTIRCWRYQNPHGQETLTQAVGNSCNPVFVQLAQRMGREKYYDYLQRFGLMEKTGVDYPAEAQNLIQSEKKIGPVELATMSFGQGIAVTPIALVSAISALGNGGYVMEPHMVSSVTDAEGKAVQEFVPTKVRQVVSEETAKQVLAMMESDVSEGGSGNAKIPGYRIGGKTGTAQKAAGGQYSDDTDSSFICMAPIDDPQITVLMVVNSPKGVHYASQTAVPGVRQILENVFRYYNVEPEYSDEELRTIKSGMVMVPDVCGQNISMASGILGGLGLEYEISPNPDFADDFAIVDQYPKAGEQVKKGSKVYLYRE